MIGTLIFYMIIRKALQVSREDDIFYIVRKEQREQSAKALKRTMTPILEEKGYMNFSFSTFKETAHIDVQFNGGVSISINVELLEDFLDDTMNVLQSLPQF